MVYNVIEVIMENNFVVKIKEFKDAKKGDLLTWDGLRWVPANIETLLSELLSKLNHLESKFEQLEIRTQISLSEIRTEIAEEKKLIATVLKGLV